MTDLDTYFNVKESKIEKDIAFINGLDFDSCEYKPTNPIKALNPSILPNPTKPLNVSNPPNLQNSTNSTNPLESDQNAGGVGDVVATSLCDLINFFKPKPKPIQNSKQNFPIQELPPELQEIIITNILNNNIDEFTAILQKVQISQKLSDKEQKILKNIQQQMSIYNDYIDNKNFKIDQDKNAIIKNMSMFKFTNNGLLISDLYNFMMKFTILISLKKTYSLYNSISFYCDIYYRRDESTNIRVKDYIFDIGQDETNLKKYNLILMNDRYINVLDINSLESFNLKLNEILLKNNIKIENIQSIVITCIHPNFDRKASFSSILIKSIPFIKKLKFQFVKNAVEKALKESAVFGFIKNKSKTFIRSSLDDLINKFEKNKRESIRKLNALYESISTNEKIKKELESGTYTSLANKDTIVQNIASVITSDLNESNNHILQFFYKKLYIEYYDKLKNIINDTNALGIINFELLFNDVFDKLLPIDKLQFMEYNIAAGGSNKVFYKGYYYKIRKDGRRKVIKTKKEGLVSISDVKKWQKSVNFKKN
jgi:hypothetical protein